MASRPKGTGLSGFLAALRERQTELTRKLETLALVVRLGRAATKPIPARPKPARKSTSPITERTTDINLLSGYKTYIVAAAMAIFAIAGLLGIEIPSFEGQAPGNLLMEALAIFFLRQGVKSAAGKP